MHVDHAVSLIKQRRKQAIELEKGGKFKNGRYNLGTLSVFSLPPCIPSYRVFTVFCPPTGHNC